MANCSFWELYVGPADLLEAYPAGEMESRPASREVNSPAKDEPRLIEPIVVGSASAATIGPLPQVS
jgi:hypothetical protein